MLVSCMELATAELNKNGKFKFCGLLNMELKKKPATPAKEPCVFKAKPASKSVKAVAMKKPKEMMT